MQDVIDADSLKQALLDGGHHHRLSSADDKQQVIAHGHLSFGSSSTDLTVHCCDIVENKDACSSAELSPSISINLLINGSVAYQLGNNTYHFSAPKDEIRIFVNVINKNELFTRSIKKGQRVKKANVFCQKEWLLNRCHTKKDIEMITTIFSANNTVYSWLANDRLIEVAAQLIENNQHGNFIDQLKVEQHALDILNHCLVKLTSTTIIESIAEPLYKPNDLTNNHSIKDKIEHLVSNKMDMNPSLNSIAAQLAMSVSTLQRKFKAQYKMTVVEYIRQKRLEHARTLLALEGKSIGETAYLVGYNHPSNFITAFKKQFNITPAALINQHWGK